MASRSRPWTIIGALIAAPILALATYNELQTYRFRNPDDDAARQEFAYFFDRHLSTSAEIVEIARSRPSLLLSEYGGCFVISIGGPIAELVGENPKGPRNSMSRCPDNFDWSERPGIGVHLEHGAPLNMVHWTTVEDDFAEVYVTEDNQFALIVFGHQ